MTPPDAATLPEGLRAFVDDDVALLPAGLTDDDRRRLIAVLAERGDAARLDRLGTSPDKALAKDARRALHKLKTQGKQAPAGARVYRVVGPYAEAPPPGRASVVDGRGERVVWYVEQADAGYSVFEAELSETAGVLAFTAVDVTRKGWRDQVAHMKRSDRAITAEIPGAHARVLMERAYRSMKTAGRSPPDDFARFHVRVQASDAELAAPHPLHALVAEDTHAPSDGELAALIERPELGLLVPPQEAIAALDAAIGEVATSQIVVEPAQRLAQLEAAILRVADELLDDALRERMAARLLELGLLVVSRQPDAQGRAIGRACVVASERLADAKVAAHDHPLVVAMYQRLVPAELKLRISEPEAR